MKKIVLFLHGYGSNGSDLITLKDYFHLNQSKQNLYLQMPQNHVNLIILDINGLH